MKTKQYDNLLNQIIDMVERDLCFAQPWSSVDQNYCLLLYI